MIGPNREVDQAITALTAELIKLSPAEGDTRDGLAITIENALSRLALAILAKSNQTQEESLEAALPGSA